MKPILSLLLLNLGGVVVAGGLALTGILGDPEEVIYTGMAGVALLTMTLGVTFLFLGRLKTLGAVLGLFILIPICLLEMFLYSWNAPFRNGPPENTQSEVVVNMNEISPELASILSDPGNVVHCSREAIPDTLLQLLGWQPIEEYIAEPDAPFTGGCVSFDDSPPSKQLVFCVESGTRWLIFYFQGGIGLHQTVKAIDLARREPEFEEGSLLTECLDPLCLEAALRKGEMMKH